MSLLAKTSSRSGFEIMKLTRRKMLTAMGDAVSSASFGKLRAADRIAPEPRQPAVPKAHDANVVPVCLADFEPLAKERLSHFAYEFIASGAADEQTIRWNREGFDQIRLRPRVLMDVEKIDMRVTLFGQEMPHPILLAPGKPSNGCFHSRVCLCC
jgi:hypothetical protein